MSLNTWVLSPRWNIPWRGAGAYLSKTFYPARKQEKLSELRNYVRVEQTNPFYANAKDLI